MSAADPEERPATQPLAAIPVDGHDGAASTIEGGAPPAAAEPLPYEMPDRKLAVAPYVLEGSAGRHLYFPLALIVAGTLMLYVGLIREASGSGQAFARAAAHRSIYVTSVVLLSLGAAAACARVLDVTFGLLTPAVVKLTAIVVVPMGIGALLGPYLSGGSVGASAEAMGLIFSLPLMWWLFFFLFRMELKEAVICCAVLTSLRMFAAIEYAYR